jgi:hypothetical protein
MKKTKGEIKDKVVNDSVFSRYQNKGELAENVYYVFHQAPNKVFFDPSYLKFILSFSPGAKVNKIEYFFCLFVCDKNQNILKSICL